MPRGVRRLRRPRGRRRAGRGGWLRPKRARARTPTSTSCSCTTPSIDPGAVAEKVWYPLWDSGSRLDHSVRSLPQMVAAAEDDLKVALACSTSGTWPVTPTSPCGCAPPCSPRWRREARDRLPELRELVRQAPRGRRASSPTSRCRTSRRRRAGCATRPSSRRSRRPGWSTCRAPSSSAPASRCSTSATCSTRETRRPTDRVAPRAVGAAGDQPGPRGRRGGPAPRPRDRAAASPTSPG